MYVQNSIVTALIGNIYVVLSNSLRDKC